MVELGSLAAGEADVAAAQAAPLGVAATGRATATRAATSSSRSSGSSSTTTASGRPGRARRLLFEGGLRIRTTVDLRVQQAAEEAVASVLTTDPDSDPSGPRWCLDPDGYVRALVGGRDFFGAEPEAKLDLATQGPGRPDGVAFKPFVLAAALAQGIPLTKVYEAPAALPCPCPTGRTVGGRQLRGRWRPAADLVDATVHSVNTVYAQLIQEVGPEKAIAMAHDLGIAAPLQPYPSAVLGTNEVTVLDMASAYATLAADGMHADPVFVTEITRADGSVLYRRPATLHRAIPAAVARGVTGILSQVVQRGTGVPPSSAGPAGRQDRHGQRVEGRLVRRLHARPRHRRVGRLPRAAAVDGPARRPRSA